MKQVLLFVMLCFIWGSTWMAIKIGLSDMPPFLSSAARFVVATLVLHGIVIVRGARYPGTWSERFHIALPGFFIYGMSYALVYHAEQHISSALTAVLFSSYPMFVALLSIWMLKQEKLHLLGWFGLMLGFAGIVVISYDSLQGTRNLFLGTLMALGGSLVSAYGVLLHKRRFTNQGVIVAAALQIAAGVIPLIFAALLFESVTDFAVTPESVGSILYLAILGTVIAFLSYYWLLTYWTAVKVALTAFFVPLVAILIGAGLFGEELGWRVAAGTALILAGVLLVIRKRSPRQLTRRPL
jgi:drug/metabolite transporter (DMT)-like permease